MSREKKKSFMDTVREVDRKERETEEKNERDAAEIRRKREEEARKSYENKLRRDKIELIKLKEGVITEDNIPKEEKIVKKYTIWEKISNFFYHEKLTIFFCAAALLIVGFIVYSVASAEHPDMTIMYLDSDSEMQYLCDEAAAVFAPYCTDVNGDGENLVNMYYIPAQPDTSNAASMQMSMSYSTQLAAEFQAGNIIMLIGTEENFEFLGIADDGTLTDMSEIYPDDENAVSFGYKLSGTKFGEKLGYDSLPKDLYFAFRTPIDLFGSSYNEMKENYDIAMGTFDNYLKENKAS